MCADLKVGDRVRVVRQAEASHLVGRYGTVLDIYADAEDADETVFFVKFDTPPSVNALGYFGAPLSGLGYHRDELERS